MMDFGGWVLGDWSWLVTAAQETAGVAAAGGVAAAPEFPFWQHLFRVAAVLGGMLGVLVLGLYLWKRSGFLKPQGVSPLIQVLATHYLAPKKALILVAVGKERLLLASAGEQLHLVTSLAPEAAAAQTGAVQEPAPLEKF
ncbi:MAG: flagellar biosynthetic protein FliO [Deltaproteobacteria bacterium]|nr:flagellar biosynthetic protein FliO [Deltaproteobacteria bacterium]